MNAKQLVFGVGGIAVILLLIFFNLSTFYTTLATPEESNTVEICFLQGNCIQAEKAISFIEQSEGLMFRESLSQDKGMLFIYSSSNKKTFWMKNTLIPLDIIWLSPEKKILGFAAATPCLEDPCPRYSSPENTQFVLEVNQGVFQTQGLAIGQKLEFEIN